MKNKSWKQFMFMLALMGILAPSTPAQMRTDSTAQYDSLASKMYAAALAENNAIAILTDLCTTVGPRLTGSSHAAHAVEWAKKEMEQLGFANVRTEPVLVPHWVRGNEKGEYSAGTSKKKIPLHVAALGGSVGTPKTGITAPLAEVKSWDELKRIGNTLKGKIVLFNRPMDRSLISPGAAYGNAVDQRSNGPSEAARYGAVAALVRSMSTREDDVPHTGQLEYADSLPRIPASAVSTLDADRLDTLLLAGINVDVTLTLGCDTLPPVESANVIGELVGGEKPQEIVVIGAHLDSWDKGQGAHDDGAGCAHVLEALRLIREFGLHPKRTIRVVLFMNEEHGLNGAITYAAEHCPVEKHIAGIESDNGGFSPEALSVTDSAACEKLQPYARLFRPVDADHIVRGGSGSDVHQIVKRGAVGIGLRVDGQRYFDYHHSDSDTIDKVNERELALGAAVVAIIAYVVAQEGF